MRVTLLGHASVLVELEGATCLMDPVLGDPFEDGAVVSCPRRRVELDELPAIDILIVSHRHPDHFDLASLDRVPRDADAICPPDPVIVHALREMGFAHVHPVVVMAPIVGPDFELLPTRSELTSIPEMGMVFRDRSGTVWNQVDTLLSEATIDAVRGQFPTVDLLLAMYASQNFEFFESRATGFPLETHRRNLETVLRIAPRLVVPASAGFRFSDDHDWLNTFLFPISRERFVADLARLRPELDCRVLDPGDVVFIGPDGHIAFRRDESPMAHTEARDTARIAFDPTAPIPPLTDTNPDCYEPIRLERLAVGLVHHVGEWAASRAAADDRVVRAYREHHVRYRIGLVFPDGIERRFDIDFTTSRTQLCEVGERGPEADLVHRISASALAGWAEHRRSFFSVRATSRRFGTVYALGRDGSRVTLEAHALPDLLMYYLVYLAEGSERAAITEVDQHLAALRVTHERP